MSPHPSGCSQARWRNCNLPAHVSLGLFLVLVGLMWWSVGFSFNLGSAVWGLNSNYKSRAIYGNSVQKKSVMRTD